MSTTTHGTLAGGAAYDYTDYNVACDTVDYIEKYWPLPVEFKTEARHRPLAYWVPIELREQTLAAYRKIGTRVRLRYRGPRAHSVGRAMPRLDGGTYSRGRDQCSQYCLLEDATHFTVYDYTGV